MRGALVLTLAVVGFGLAAAPASAATFPVDSTADDPDQTIDGSCDNGSGDCTLRAAIEEANAGGGPFDSITFDPGVFDGTAASSTIQLLGALPDITGATQVVGSNCGTLAAPKPCAGVRGQGPGAFDGIVFRNTPTVSAISGLALTNLRTAVLIDGAQNSLIEGSFIGLDLAGAQGPNGTGIHVTGTPDSTVDTRIGGDTPAEENLISANAGDAIRVSRVDGVAIHGNRGAANGGRFIDLEDPDGPGNFSTTGSAEGLQPPVAQPPTSDTALGGTGEPNATVRVFTTAGISPGELGALLATTVADGNGAWAATFPAQADGTHLVATQTVPGTSGADQTSEVGAGVGIGGAPVATITARPPARLKARKRKVRGDVLVHRLLRRL